MLSLRHWRAPHLLAAWAAYWVVLALAVLGEPLLRLREITRLPDGRSSASASFRDGAVDVQLVADGAAVWQGQASLTAILLWLVVPPLLLWGAWLVARPTVPPASPPAPPPPPRELRPGDPALDDARRRERAEPRR